MPVKFPSNPAHLAKVAELGCIICSRPAEVHHVRHGNVGMGRRPPDLDAIPLCPEHHRTGGYKVAIHAGRRGFEDVFGPAVQLLQLTRERLGILEETDATQ